MAYSGSISSLFSSTEALGTFFKPFQLDLELADLPVKSRQKVFSFFLCLFSSDSREINWEAHPKTSFPDPLSPDGK